MAPKPSLGCGRQQYRSYVEERQDFREKRKKGWSQEDRKRITQRRYHVFCLFFIQICFYFNNYFILSYKYNIIVCTEMS